MNHPTDQIETYLAGGLTPGEQSAFDLHVAECPPCSTALDEARAADAALNALFSPARPPEGFEERVIASLRQRQSRLSRRFVHPLVRRVAVGLAASVVLATLGYVGDAAMNGRDASLFYVFESRSAAPRGQVLERVAAPLHVASERPYLSSRNPVAADALPDVAAAAPALPSAIPPAPLSTPSAPLFIPNVGLAIAPNSQGKGDGTANFKSTPRGGEYAYNYFSSPKQDKSKGASTAVPDFSDAPDFSLNSARVSKTSNPQGGGGGGKESKPVAGSTGKPASGNYPADHFDSYTLPTDDAAKWTDQSRGNGAHHYFDASAIKGKPVAQEPEILLLGGQKVEVSTTTTPPSNAPAAVADDGKKSEADISAKDAKIAVLQTSVAEAEKAAADKDAHIAALNSDKVQLNAAVAGANAAVQVARADMKAREETKPTPDAAPSAPPAKPAPPADAPKRQAADAEAPHPAPVIKPKIIRTGEMEFEVDHFDSSVLTITKIVEEDGGYVSTTNSDKLPNGKVKGSIILRIAPERLDTLILKLRGIGDLKTQRIAAQDITKQYTDLSSALRAAQAMQERLLDIIKNGKGAVKDLLEAEKQLGVWREKVEQLEGEIRFYDSQVALSTLVLTLFERDIRMAAIASEAETVTMALETENVEDAYAKAKDAVAQVKGRIVNSSLKQYDAGQYGASISAAVPPDSADAFLGRLKQIEGRVARFDRARSQTTSNGNNPVDPRSTEAVKVKREDVIVNLTLYNLANVAPRRWTNLTLVAANVDETYRTLIEQVKSAGGRIVESQINHPSPDQTTGNIKLDIPSEKADAILLALRRMGETLQVNTTENASTQDVTESKRGFVVSIGSLSAFKPRETQQIQLAATNVPGAFSDLQNTIRLGKGRILTSHLDEQDSRNAVGTLEFEMGRESQASFEQAMNKDGQIVSRLADHSMDTDNTVDSKVHIKLTVGSSEQLPPRQTSELSVEVSDVQKAMDDLQAAVLSAGGRQIDNPAISQGDGSQTIARVSFDVPLDKIQTLIDASDAMGARKGRQTSIDARAPEGKLARARLKVTFATPAALAGSDDSILAGIRRGLGTSLRWLSTSFTLIVVGLCVVLPWVVLVWGGWRGVKWMRRPAGIPKSE